MIIAITAQEASLQSQVDPRFGRAAVILFANTRTGDVYAHENSDGQNAANGAGTSAAQLLAESGVDLLLTGSVGPKAADVLEKAGIQVQENVSGTVEEALDQLTRNNPVPVETDLPQVDPPDAEVLRLAVPADTGDGLQAPRSGHFGKCAYYTLVDIQDNRVQRVIPLKNAGHTPGGCFAPVMLLGNNHVHKLIVGGIGGRPLQGFRDSGIEVYAGHGHTVQDTVDLFLADRIQPISSDQVCGGGVQ